MTTAQLVDRYLRRILQTAKDIEKGKNLHIADQEIDSAILGAVEAFAFIGEHHPSEGFAELLHQLKLEPRSNHTPYANMIKSAINKVEAQLNIWK